MQNPCETCIVRVNCTQICPEKENYTTLLNHAYMQHNSAIKGGASFRRDIYQRVIELSDRNWTDKSKIKNRVIKLGGKI